MAELYPLSGVRVVEVSRFVGSAYCAKLFAELGAEVLAIEPVEGHPLRRRPIDPGGDSDSLFQYLFTNKRVAPADLDAADGQRRLRAATEQADVVVTDYGLDELNRIYQDIGGVDGLSERLVLVRVKPYVGCARERSGPFSYFTAFHSGGEGYLMPGGSEYLGRPPVKVAQYAGEYDAGTQAAIGGMAALYARRRGIVPGDRVEASVQASIANMLRAALGKYTVDGRVESRDSRGPRPGSTLRCADGFVELMPQSDVSWDRLVELMGRPEWTGRPGMRDAEWKRTHVAGVNELLETWTGTRGKQEVEKLCQKAHIPAGSVATISEVLASEQLKHRQFFETGRSGRVYPGLPFTVVSGALPPVDDCSAGDLDRPFCDGASPAQPRKADAANRAPAGDRPLPLAGVRVVEFSWFWAVPFAGMLLAALGAEVVKVESMARLDGIRFADVDPAADHAHERSTLFHDANLDKKSITLDLSAPGAAEVALELVRHADIVMQNYSVGVLARLGLSYEKMREVNPNVVIVSETTSGEEGPASHYVGYATVFGALSGMGGCVGYPGCPPADVRDGADLRIATTVALAAVALLLRRQAQGCGGEVVSVSAVESLSRYVGEALVERARGGFEYDRNGNQDPVFCPNNGYPCAGTDQWVAISVRDDDDWRALRKLAGRPELDDARFAHVEGRRQHENEIDRIIGGWTAGQDAQKVAELLCAGGVPASAVYTAKMMFEDEQLKAAGFLPVVEHRYLGRRAVVGVPWEFTRLRAEVRNAAPLVGEHNEDVLGGWLGLDQTKLTELESRGILR